VGKQKSTYLKATIAEERARREEINKREEKKNHLGKLGGLWRASSKGHVTHTSTK